MRPKDVCLGPKCIFHKKVPEILICPACKEVADKKEWTPLNIIYCRKVEHKDLRAPIAEIKKAWEKYLGKFTCKTPDSDIKISVNFMFQSHNATSNSSRESSKNAPSINTTSGAIEKPKTGKIIQEKPDDSFYLMQTLKIGSSNVLAFLDSGSNAHLIYEHIARSEGLLKTSERSKSISVVGGGNIRSSRSSYQFNLGPGANGEFFEMNCIGMEAVTTKFNEYDLTEIGIEYKRSLHPDQQDIILPKKIGGSQVLLLIGIKNANLNPILEKVLESGVAVFTSPFKDIYGSNKIFAGPHKTFTKGNRGARTHAVYALREEIENILTTPMRKSQTP